MKAKGGMLNDIVQEPARRSADFYFQSLASYLRDNLTSEFDPSKDRLLDVLDSVGFLRLIIYIDEEFGITLDPVLLSLEVFADVGTLSSTLVELDPRM